MRLSLLARLVHALVHALALALPGRPARCPVVRRRSIAAVARVTHIVAKYALVVVVVGLVGTLQAGSTMKCLALPSAGSLVAGVRCARSQCRCRVQTPIAVTGGSFK